MTHLLRLGADGHQAEFSEYRVKRNRLEIQVSPLVKPVGGDEDLGSGALCEQPGGLSQWDPAHFDIDQAVEREPPSDLAEGARRLCRTARTVPVADPLFQDHPHHARLAVGAAVLTRTRSLRHRAILTPFTSTPPFGNQRRSETTRERRDSFPESLLGLSKRVPE